MKAPWLITLVILATHKVAAQNEDALNIPVENDNQFPPDHLESEGVFEGSGAGVVEGPNVVATTETISAPSIESIDPDVTTESAPTLDTNELPCPKPCVCSIEGDKDNFIADCSGYDLTEFPTGLDLKTTTLKLHNNKLTKIPRELSALKKLQILNLDNNSIMDLAAGSVSELPELVTLKLAKNRLIEYPNDLKNSISLTKLQELDLGENDMRTVLTSEMFSNLKSLRKLTLPAVSSELVLDLCGSLKDSLEAVCSNSCSTTTFECPDAPPVIDDSLIDATLPGMISLSNALLDNENDVETDPVVQTETTTVNSEAAENTNRSQVTIDTTTSTEQTTISATLTRTDKKNMVRAQNKHEDQTNADKSSPQSVNEFSLRTAVNNEPEEDAGLNTVVDVKNIHEEVKVGAKTLGTKTGGVDKSVIGVIIAGMIIVVAAITIKKNWSSITKKFETSPRLNERTEVRANGSSPEEVPLNDKSPV